jgi:hypothetical protein
MGARYLAMLPATSLPDLPSPIRAAIKFGRADLGHVQESNKMSIDSQVTTFLVGLMPLDLTSSLLTA